MLYIEEAAARSAGRHLEQFGLISLGLDARGLGGGAYRRRLRQGSAVVVAPWRMVGRTAGCRREESAGDEKEGKTRKKGVDGGKVGFEF